LLLKEKKGSSRVGSYTSRERMGNDEDMNWRVKNASVTTHSSLNIWIAASSQLFLVGSQ
jgi:hypothetical protein